LTSWLAAIRFRRFGQAALFRRPEHARRREHPEPSLRTAERMWTLPERLRKKPGQSRLKTWFFGDSASSMERVYARASDPNFAESGDLLECPERSSAAERAAFLDGTVGATRLCALAWKT
jgi:hypothetical protein